MTLMGGFFISLLCVVSAAFAQAPESTAKTYVQVGQEYDTNVLKTFNQSRGDFLTRALFHAGLNPVDSEKFKLGLLYDGGGKVFYRISEQNMLIQSLRIPMTVELHPNANLFFRTFLKYQDENNDVDEDNLDVNEDYFSVRQLATANATINDKHRFRVLGEFGYFHFFPRRDFSFFSERMAVEYRYRLQSRIWISSHYSLLLQQFRGSDRSDTEHEISAGLHAFIIPYVSLKYHFEVNQSTVDLFDSTNHRVTLLVSHLFGKKKDSDESGIFSVHFLTTLQIRNFPSVTGETAEGERFLLSGAEDQFFNQVTLKLAYHPKEKWAIETKYSRYSNAFTTADTDFARDLYYAGFRYSF